MKLETTIFSNYELVIDEFDIPVAVQINGEVKYRLYDLVRVTDDGRGYICPGIEHEGIGRIVEIRRSDSDNFFGVLMDNGEFGFMKFLRLKLIPKLK